MTTSNQPTLNDYARRMRNLVEEDVRIAADLRELAKEMRDCGYQAVVLKAVIKALVAQENGDEKPMERLKARTQEIAIYADALGEPIDGFGETKHFVVNHSENGGHPQGELEASPPVGDAETRPVVESPHACGDGAVQDRCESTAPTNPGAKAGNDEARVAADERAEAKADAPDPSDPVSRGEPKGERALPRPPGITPAGEPGHHEAVSAETVPAPNSVAPGTLLPGSKRASYHGAGHADEAAPVVGAGNPAPENSPERREGEQAPEATPSSSSNPVPDGGETAASLLDIPWFLKRNPDNSLPGRAG